MDMTFYIVLGIFFVLVIVIILWLVRDYFKEKKDYPFKHKKEN